METAFNNTTRFSAFKVAQALNLTFKTRHEENMSRKHINHGNNTKAVNTLSTQKNVRIHELLDYIRKGRIMEAMHEFYDEEVVMEEPAYGKTVGLHANLVREQQFVDSIAEFKGFETPAVMIGNESSSYENIMDWTSSDCREIHVEQVAVQRWRNGKIFHERFYYNT